MKNAEVAPLARQRCTSILCDLEFARATMASNGALVQRRWLKKSDTKRKAFLKQMRPVMAEIESEMLDVINGVEEEFILLQQHRETFILPHMNIETLSKDGSRLLRLLSYRIKYLPESCVTFDNRPLLTGWHLGAFKGNSSTQATWLCMAPHLENRDHSMQQEVCALDETDDTHGPPISMHLMADLLNSQSTVEIATVPRERC